MAKVIQEYFDINRPENRIWKKEDKNGKIFYNRDCGAGVIKTPEETVLRGIEKGHFLPIELVDDYEFEELEELIEKYIGYFSDTNITDELKLDYMHKYEYYIKLESVKADREGVEVD